MKDYELIELACKIGKCTPKEIVDKSSVSKNVNTRYLAFVLLHKYCRMSDENIAMLFNRTKNNIYNGIQTTKSALNTYESLGITTPLVSMCLEAKLIITGYEKLN
jgi:hypothetical protein